MSGFKKHLGLCLWEDPIRDAAWRCSAFFVSGGGGESERPRWLYMGSKETSLCRLRRIPPVMGRGANQSCGVVSMVEDGSVSSAVGESVSMAFPVVMG